MCWQGVGTMLARRWYAVGEVLARCWRGVGEVLARCWRMARQQQANTLAKCWHIVPTCWHSVGTPRQHLPTCWRVVGEFCQHVANMLAICWRAIRDHLANTSPTPRQHHTHTHTRLALGVLIGFWWLSCWLSDQHILADGPLSNIAALWPLSLLVAT